MFQGGKVLYVITKGCIFQPRSTRNPYYWRRSVEFWNFWSSRSQKMFLENLVKTIWSIQLQLINYKRNVLERPFQHCLRNLSARATSSERQGPHTLESGRDPLKMSRDRRGSNGALNANKISRSRYGLHSSSSSHSSEPSESSISYCRDRRHSSLVPSSTRWRFCRQRRFHLAVRTPGLMYWVNVGSWYVSQSL